MGPPGPQDLTNYVGPFPASFSGGDVRVINGGNFKVLKPAGGLAADFISTTTTTQQVVGINAGSNANRGLYIVGTICVTGGTVCSSDERLKSNISELTDVLAKIHRIRAVSYNWKDEPGSQSDATNHKQIGVLAQEVQRVFPELVSPSGQGDYLAVDYGKLTAVLIGAVNQLDAERDDLLRRVETLERAIGADNEQRAETPTRPTERGLRQSH